MELKQAVEQLLSSYGDIRREGSTMVVDAYELQDALKKVEAGSAEELVLNILAESNPTPEMLEADLKKAKKKVEKIEAKVEAMEDAVRASE